MRLLGTRAKGAKTQEQFGVASLASLIEQVLDVIWDFEVPVLIVATGVGGNQLLVMINAEPIGEGLEHYPLGSIEAWHRITVGIKHDTETIVSAHGVGDAGVCFPAAARKNIRGLENLPRVGAERVGYLSILLSRDTEQLGGFRIAPKGALLNKTSPAHDEDCQCASHFGPSHPWERCAAVFRSQWVAAYGHHSGGERVKHEKLIRLQPGKGKATKVHLGQTDHIHSHSLKVLQANTRRSSESLFLEWKLEPLLH